jgi:amino acid transporter
MINLNIMLGTGIFLNSIPLATNAGMFNLAPYAIIGILFIPIMIAMATLLNHEPDGSFYGIASRHLGPFWGYISTWAYFIVKPASAGVMIHFSVSLFRQLFPVLMQWQPLAIDSVIITIFMVLNLLNMRIGKSIQISFIFLKVIPVLFIILAGLWWLNPHNFTYTQLPVGGIIFSLPLALYAFVGFEATLSLSKHLENPQKNAPLAIIFSYLIVLVIYMLYQIGYYGAINLAQLPTTSSDHLITLFLQSIYQTPHPTLQALLHLCMGISALGGAYGILFSNAWNLHSLSERNHTPLSQYLVARNSGGIAYWCLFIEVALCAGYLFVTNANQIMLQQINAFGCTLAYTLSIVAFAALAFKIIKKRWARVTAWFALLSCSMLIASCVNGFMKNGPAAFYAFIGLIIIGIISYKKSRD